MNRFDFVVVQSALHDQAAVDEIIAPVADWLRVAGRERLALGPAAGPVGSADRPLLIVVATGGTEAAVLDLVARRDAIAPGEPVVLISHAGHNSLPASLEAMARLRLEGRAGRIVPYGAAGEPLAAVGDLRALQRLRGARLGLVGKPSEWLVASVPEADAVADTWGIELVEVDITQAIDSFRRGDEERTREVAVKLARGPEPDADVLVAAGLHPALVDVIESYAVDAVTVRCFDFLGELHTSGCVALAELNDSGVVAGCEGDVAAAVAMMLVRELLDSPSWIANPADIAGDRLLLAHCTIAPSLVGEVEVHTHFESGIGIGLRGTFAPGDVTLLRLGGRGLEQNWIAEATIVGTGDSPDLCRTQVSLDVEPGRLTELLAQPLGNHIVLVPGRHRARIEAWLRLAQIGVPA